MRAKLLTGSLCCRCYWREQPWPVLAKHTAASLPDFVGAT